jgi:membrane protease YdiL (CAAX protease family)
MPAWPGWLVAVIGGISMVTGLGGAGAVAQGQLEVANPAVFDAAMIGGGIAFTFGLVYASIRSLRLRRFLPPERYRGPSPVILLLLAVVGAMVAQLPFIGDVVAWMEGREQSDAASFVLLTSTQAGLLLVTGLFVALPRALPGAPPLAGGKVGRSIGLGLAWGIAGWVVATAVGFAITVLFREIGLEPDTQLVEEALNSLNPVIVAFAAIVVAPIAEETFFRGVVYNAWRREHGRRIATYGSALLFAVIHVALISLLPIFLLGIGLAVLYERTRSLLAAIVMHAAFNTISVALTLLERYEVITLPT